MGDKSRNRPCDRRTTQTGLCFCWSRREGKIILLGQLQNNFYSYLFRCENADRLGIMLVGVTNPNLKQTWRLKSCVVGKMAPVVLYLPLGWKAV